MITASLTGRLAVSVAAVWLGWPTVAGMTGIRWWGVVSSAVAPVLLAGGWTLAARLQPGGFDSVTGTISALAAAGAADRWVMTVALLGVGGCHVVTGLALRPAGLAGRMLLMAGGVAVVLVALNPVPAGGGRSLPHTVAAAVAFAALAVWPTAAWRRGHAVPFGLRPAVSGAAAGVLLGLVVWFSAELRLGGGQVGLAERAAAGAQALWPLTVVLTCCQLPGWIAHRPRRLYGHGKAGHTRH